MAPLRGLKQADRDRIDRIITAHLPELKRIRGFISARAGFPVSNHKLVREPAILVFLREKLRPEEVGARNGLTAAMYDFNADYIANSLIDVVEAQGFAVTLTLDDDDWSRRSQPLIDPIGDPATAHGMFTKGNREWHVIVTDVQLADVFKRCIVHDRDKARADAMLGVEPFVEPEVFVRLDDLAADFEPAALADPILVPPKLLPPAKESQPRPEWSACRGATSPETERR
jgi:hypothetical protein